MEFEPAFSPALPGRTALPLRVALLLALAIGLLLMAGCDDNNDSAAATPPSGQDATATLTMAGSGKAGSTAAAASANASNGSGTSQTSAQSIPGGNNLADVAAKTKPVIVQITNEQQSLQWRSSTLVPAGVGTGFVFDQQGHILTNSHVVADAQALVVDTTDGKSFPATLVGRDDATDLAVLQVQGQNLPVVPLGDSSKLTVGQWVVAIGNALALPGGPTVTAGVISALNRTVQEPGSDQGSGG